MNRYSFANSEGENGAAENENFTVCPQFFLADLTPEQYRAQQELYRRAFEKAQRQQQQQGLSGDAISFDI